MLVSTIILTCNVGAAGGVQAALGAFQETGKQQPCTRMQRSGLGKELLLGACGCWLPGKTSFTGNKEATTFQDLSQTKREEDPSVSLEQNKSQP